MDKTVSKDRSNSAEKTTKIAGEKRKKNFNPDDESLTSVKPKIAKKSENKTFQSTGAKDEENAITGPRKKDTKQRTDGIKDNNLKMKKKKFGPKSDMRKNMTKNSRKLPTDASRTESLDKKHEARRKRRAKGKVHSNQI